jgi:hypothetical protein
MMICVPLIPVPVLTCRPAAARPCAAVLLSVCAAGAPLEATLTAG